jgi:diguanylate cyclase (GGDEF)-like protein/PAS domain S-box-containing protein
VSEIFGVYEWHGDIVEEFDADLRDLGCFPKANAHEEPVLVIDNIGEAPQGSIPDSTSFKLVLTKAAYVHAWYDAGADSVFAVDSNDRFGEHLRGVKNSIQNLVEARRSLKTKEREKDELETTVESLEIASGRFEALFNGLPVACFTFDTGGVIHEWNDLATQVFGIESYAAFMNTAEELLDHENNGVWNLDNLSNLFNGAPTIEFDWKYTRHDGKTIYLACKVLGLTNRKGDVIAAVAGNLDITERVLAEQKVNEQILEIRSYLKVMETQRIKLQDANRQLRRLAVTDGLTGLTNRRRFNELLDESIDRAIRQGQYFSILLFDIDFFKKLNDEYGHQAGDDVLVKFAKVLHETSRKYERPARYGGEEFAIILDNCDAAASRIAAERFRAAILSAVWPHRDITVSIGCSSFSGVGSARSMVEQADEALYYSKQQGRNRVTHRNDMPVKQVVDNQLKAA